MESNEIRRIKFLIYLSIISSFIAGFILLFISFDDNKSLIEIHSSSVIFPLFVPFLIGLVCLYSSRRKNVSLVYLPITLLIGSILLFYFQIGMFGLVGIMLLFICLVLLYYCLHQLVLLYLFSEKERKNNVIR